MSEAHRATSEEEKNQGHEGQPEAYRTVGQIWKRC